MYDDGNNRHYFINEPAMLRSGEIVLPVRWLEDEDGEVWMEVWSIVLNAVTVSLVDICTRMIDD